MPYSRTIGKILIAVSLLLALLDRITSLISDRLGEQYCGSDYLQPVDGVVGDVSCGFNADMYLMVLLGAVFLYGLRLLRDDRYR